VTENEVIQLKDNLLTLLEIYREGILPKYQTDELISLLKEYWKLKKTEFKPKLNLDDEIIGIDSWSPPILIFMSLGSSLYSFKKWSYDFNEDMAVYIRFRPRDKPYTKELARKDAEEIATAIANDSPHHAVDIRGNKKVVKLRSVNGVSKSNNNQTLIGRVDRLREAVKEAMRAYPQFIETTYRNGLAYEKKAS